jgi:hypothetical protein
MLQAEKSCEQQGMTANDAVDRVLELTLRLRESSPRAGCLKQACPVR